MKTRIIIAVIFVPLLFVILFFLPPVAMTLVVSAIAAIASYELLYAAGPLASKKLCSYVAISAAAIPIGFLIGPGDIIFRAVLFLLMAVLFCDAVLSYKTKKQITLAHMAAVVFGGAVIPYFLTSLVSIRLLGNGRLYVLIPFIIAFITDGGAYFTGVSFGKHRAFPNVSPKKTVEGCVGGIMTGIAAMAVYGVILYLSAGYAVNFLALSVYGLLGSVVTELGDLAFSLIKRQFGVKDYGSLIPGHGGMLDRFDSMIFVAPAIYLLILLLPAF